MSKIVVVLGYNASGKSTHVKEFVDRGYSRVNRDEMGGTLDGQANYVKRLIDSGVRNIVLDNTYPTIESRKSIVGVARETGSQINCIWLKTSFEDAQFNACLRMVAKYGTLQGPDDFKKNKDPNCFPPAALYNYRKIFQAPTTTEGFASIEERSFVRKWPNDHVHKALFLDYDGTLRVSTGSQEWPEDPSHVKILPNRIERLNEYVAQGFLLFGVSNQSAISKGLDTQKVVDCFEKTNELLGHKIEYQFCSHKIPPVSCYCRKPAPGMAAYFIQKYKLNPSECIMVGDQTTDKTFADRSGVPYKDASDFFGK